MEPLGDAAHGGEAEAHAAKARSLTAGAAAVVEGFDLAVFAAPEPHAAVGLPAPQARDVAPAAPPAVAHQALAHFKFL